MRLNNLQSSLRMKRKEKKRKKIRERREKKKKRKENTELVLCEVFARLLFLYSLVTYLILAIHLLNDLVVQHQHQIAHPMRFSLLSERAPSELNLSNKMREEN